MRNRDLPKSSIGTKWQMLSTRQACTCLVSNSACTPKTASFTNISMFLVNGPNKSKKINLYTWMFGWFMMIQKFINNKSRDWLWELVNSRFEGVAKTAISLGGHEEGHRIRTRTSVPTWGFPSKQIPLRLNSVWGLLSVQDLTLDYTHGWRIAKLIATSQLVVLTVK